MTNVIRKSVFADQDAVAIAEAYLEVHGYAWALDQIDRELAALCDARDAVVAAVVPVGDQ